MVSIAPSARRNRTGFLNDFWLDSKMRDSRLELPIQKPNFRVAGKEGGGDACITSSPFSTGVFSNSISAPPIPPPSLLPLFFPPLQSDSAAAADSKRGKEYHVPRIRGNARLFGLFRRNNFLFSTFFSRSATDGKCKWVGNYMKALIRPSPLAIRVPKSEADWHDLRTHAASWHS